MSLEKELSIVNSAVDKLINDWQKDYDRIFPRIERGVVSIYNDFARQGLDVTPVYSEIVAGVNKAINSSGYGELTSARLDETYKQLTDKIYDAYKAGAGRGFKFTDDGLARLTSLKNANVLLLDEVTARMRNGIANAIFQLEFGQTERETAIAQLRNLFTGDNKAYVKTWVDTATSSYYREVNAQGAEELGFEYYQYVGQDDNLTRPFCAEHLDGIKTKAEWQELANGQIGNAWTHGGGFNCRHYFVPVDKKNG